MKVLRPYSTHNYQSIYSLSVKITPKKEKLQIKIFISSQNISVTSNAATNDKSANVKGKANPDKSNFKQSSTNSYTCNLKARVKNLWSKR